MNLPRFETTAALRDQARSMSTWDILHELVFLTRMGCDYDDKARAARCTFAIRLSAVYRAEVLRRVGEYHPTTPTISRRPWGWSIAETSV